MKKILFATVLVASVALFASCQKNEAVETTDEEELPVVHLKLSNGGDLNTKSFFDETATAEDFEKQISSLSIFVFDSSDNIVCKKNFTTQELSDKSCTFKLPKTVAGTKCQFYAVANYDVTSVTTKQALLNALDNKPEDYNGAFSDVTTKSLRDNGFVMTGKTEETVAQTGSTTNVSITIKRTVSKIAVKITIDDSFEEIYGGKLAILSTSIEKAPVSAYIIEPSSSTNIQTTYTTTQEIEDEPNSLFYIFENEHIQDHGNVVLKINAEYDIDGSYLTSADRYTFSYTVPITGSGNGVIKRNGYYRINATIYGPEGESCKLSITASDWETPSTQDVELGN